MPETQVVMFQDTDGMVPLLRWMDRLLPNVQDKLVARIELLIELAIRRHLAFAEDPEGHTYREK